MFHVGFFFQQPSLTKQGHINAAFDKVALDWIRYSSQTWVAYAESSDRLHIFIREAIDPGDSFLIVPIDMEAHRQGLMPDWVWRWLDIDRSKPGWQTLVAQIRESLSPPPPPPPAPTLEELFKNYLPSASD